MLRNKSDEAAEDHLASSGVVIVGAGQAGARCALALRQEGYSGKIALIGEEPHLPYERPPLSKQVITSQEDVYNACPAMVSSEQLAELKIDLRPNVVVTHADLESHTVKTTDGEVIPFRYLVLATGSRARPWSFEGVESSAVHLVRNLTDAQRLKSELRPGRKVLIVGGGFIGLEIAGSARELGCVVSIVEPQPQLLGRVLSSPGAEQIHQLHLGHGETVHLGRSISDVQANSAGYGATLDDGTSVEFEVVVAGIGSIPNVELASEAGLVLCPVTGGVSVSADCTTSHVDVYAVGDIAAKFNSLYGRRFRFESWENAEIQAATAARSIAGRVTGVAEHVSESPSDHVPWFWTEQHGVNLQILGIVAGSELTVVRGDLESKGILFHFRGKRLIAAELFNSARDRRIIKQWIKEGTRVSADVLRDAGQPLVKAVQPDLTEAS